MRHALSSQGSGAPRVLPNASVTSTVTSLLILAARLLLENADQPGQASLGLEFKDLYLVDPPRIVTQSTLHSPALVLKRNSVGLAFEDASGR